MFKAASGAVYRHVKVAPSGARPSFSLSLLSSLIPELFAGSGTPTMVRATAAAHTDFEGIVRQVPADAARFQGCRFVFNAIPSAGSGSASLAVAANKTVTVTAGTWVFSMGAETTGTGVATFTGTATGSSGTLTADATRRTAATLTITVGGTVIITASVQALANLQLENVTTRTNKNPSEYVPSVSTANADSGAIGCRFFSYLNGNSVASTIVTEAKGAAITSAAAECAGGVAAGVVDASGPKGFLSEGVRTNLALQSQTFATAPWSATDAGTNATISADTTVAPDGTTTADSLVEDGDNNSHWVQQAFTFSAAAHTYSVHLKAGTREWAVLQVFDGTTSFRAYVHLTGAGSLGTVSGAGATAAILAALPNGWYRVSITATTLAATGALYIFGATGDGGISYVGSAGTAPIIVWGAQLEAA